MHIGRRIIIIIIIRNRDENRATNDTNTAQYGIMPMIVVVWYVVRGYCVHLSSVYSLFIQIF